ncbi:MAG: DMT family transporter [Chloroflexota bacterium]
MALLVVLIAAVLHAVSNFLFKGGRDSSAMLWWSVTLGALWYGVFVATQSSFAMPLETWTVFIPSMIAEIAYARLITYGYADGDLSQIYPIARGAPLLLIPLVGAIFLGERLPLLGYCGVALLIGGIYLASLLALGDWARPLRALKHRPTQIALLAALCVTLYTLLDKIGMQSATPMVYNWWVYGTLAVGYAPFVWSRANRASTAREFWTNWRRILIASVATVGSYLAALTGLSMSAASYVSSVRATSVVMGALLGWLLLKEQLGALRVFAAALMVAGLMLIVVA